MAFGCTERQNLTVAFAVPGHWYRAVRLALEDHPAPSVTIIWDTVPGLSGGAGGAIYWADWHASEGVDVVIGHDASRHSVGAAGVYNRAGIVQLAPVATSGMLEAQGPWSFGMVPNGATEGAFIAAFVDSVLRGRRVALMYNNDEFGLDLRRGVTVALGDRAVSIVDERYFNAVSGEADPDVLDPLFRAALLSDPDVIVMAGRDGDVLHLMRFLRDVPDPPHVVSSDGGVVRQPGSREWSPIVDGLFVVRLWRARTPAAAEFVARFTARWGESPDDAEALTYDATRLILAAARDGAGSAAEVRGWLQQLGRERPPFPGLASDFSFRNGRPFGPQLWMDRVSGGTLVPADGGTP